MPKFQIYVDSASDMPKTLRQAHDIDYFRMNIVIGEKEYHADLDFEEYGVEELYAWIGDLDNRCHTSLVPAGEFLDKTEESLKRGLDVLYLACACVLSGSKGVFDLAIETLARKYPERKLISVDTCRAGLAQGLIAIDVAKLRDEGKTIEEAVSYVEENKLKYNLCGTVSTLTYLKAAGRVSEASAFFGNLFGVKPIIVADALGHNVAVSKAKGTKNAYNELFDFVKNTVEGQEHPTIYVGQGRNEEGVKYFRERFEKELGATVIDYYVGPIIGISCGPGVIHICCFGKVADTNLEDK